MQFFNDRVLGPDSVKVLSDALNEWLLRHGVAKQSEDAALAASVFLVLFSEGNVTVPELRAAAQKHKWLGNDALFQH
ncbi:hypothetical protein [Oryzifoliimicrobium ureilyticus]|uniref:hypothetical protein n=1 Tax=Oryzifoliimicrobium ureilyticus TaxID=3113724 RepID=UPI00307666BE